MISVKNNRSYERDHQQRDAFASQGVLIEVPHYFARVHGVYEGAYSIFDYGFSPDRVRRCLECKQS